MKGDNIAERLLGFANMAVRVSREVTTDATTRHIVNQLVRAGTAAAAHSEEARSAESRSDFIHKVSLSAKELREATYWMKLVEKANLTTRALDIELREGGELIAILHASRCSRGT